MNNEFNKIIYLPLSEEGFEDFKNIGRISTPELVKIVLHNQLVLSKKIDKLYENKRPSN